MITEKNIQFWYAHKSRLLTKLLRTLNAHRPDQSKIDYLVIMIKYANKHINEINNEKDEKNRD